MVLGKLDDHMQKKILNSYLTPHTKINLKWTEELNIRSETVGFPGGAVVKNLPSNAGDTGSSPGPGRSHMPQSNSAREPQLLSLLSTACEPQLLKPVCLEPMLCNKRSHRNEKPAHRNEEEPLLAATRGSPRAVPQTQCSQK